MPAQTLEKVMVEILKEPKAINIWVPCTAYSLLSDKNGEEKYQSTCRMLCVWTFTFSCMSWDDCARVCTYFHPKVYRCGLKRLFNCNLSSEFSMKNCFIFLIFSILISLWQYFQFIVQRTCSVDPNHGDCVELEGSYEVERGILNWELSVRLKILMYLRT